jgi:hypothetical protein
MSDEVEHTPAPWEAERLGTGTHKVSATQSNEEWGPPRIARVQAHPNRRDDLVTYDKARANARLIAAAPELLKAAKHSLDVLTRIKATHEHLLSKELLTELDNAIAKAEGRNE